MSRAHTRSWPSGTIDLLIRTALSPPDEARGAWEQWKRSRDFDDVAWQEMRLLTPIAPRLAELDPETPLLPRIEGLAKNRWLQTQLKLSETAPAFDSLAAAGIPYLVFKGAAQHAELMAAAGRRVVADIDILVRPEKAIEALDALESGGWMATNGESFRYLRRLAGLRLSGNFHRGRYGDVDLHISPFHFARRDDALDEALWRDAVSGVLNKRSVLVPGATDAVLILLAHSAHSENGDWTIDIATRMERQAIDWPRLVDMAGRRGIVPSCEAGLGYLAQIGVPVPPTVLTALREARIPFAERLKYWSNVRERRARRLHEKLGNRLADLALRRRNFSLIVKDRVAITVARPTWSPMALAYRMRRSPAMTAPVLEQEISPTGNGSSVFLAVRLALPAQSRRLFFDLSVGDTAVARLRGRAGGTGAASVTKLFRIPAPPELDAGSMLRISARPTGHLAPNATQAEIAEIGALPFQLLACWRG